VRIYQMLRECFAPEVSLSSTTLAQSSAELVGID